MNRSRRGLIDQDEIYVSRAAYKLDSVALALKLDFRDKIVLDVGSSSGGFSDYALQHGASKVVAVDRGTGQMDVRLRRNKRIELHEKTDIRDFVPSQDVDLVLIDVSFVSIKQILPIVSRAVGPQAIIVLMAKPQFEAETDNLMHKGVIKNERVRRRILADLESWLKKRYLVQAKADSKIAGTKGNKERFYKLKVLA